MDMRKGPTLRRQMGYFNPRECAEICGVNFWTFYDFIERGLVSRPMARLSKSFYYSTKDVEEIKQQLKGSAK